MKLAIQILLTVALVCALPRAVQAQVDVDGATSISLGGFMFLGADNGSVNTTVGLNKFLAGGLEVGGFVSLNATYSPGGSSTTSGFTFGKLRYNKIGESLTVPFIEIGAGTQLDEPGAGGRPLLLQGGAGFKRFINDQVSFDVTGNFQGTMIDGSIQFTNALFLTYGLTIYLN